MNRFDFFQSMQVLCQLVVSCCQWETDPSLLYFQKTLDHLSPLNGKWLYCFLVPSLLQFCLLSCFLELRRQLSLIQVIHFGKLLKRRLAYWFVSEKYKMVKLKWSQQTFIIWNLLSIIAKNVFIYYLCFAVYVHVCVYVYVCLFVLSHTIQPRAFKFNQYYQSTQ